MRLGRSWPISPTSSRTKNSLSKREPRTIRRPRLWGKQKLQSGYGLRQNPLPNSSEDALGGVLGQFGQALAMTLGGSNDLHLLPVIRKFFTAVEASDVSSGQSSGLGAARCPTNGYRKAIVRVPAAE